MKYGYCNQRMEEGTIQSAANRQIYYLPKGKSVPIANKAQIKTDDGFILSKGLSNKVKAYYCPDCKKVIIDL